jgi:hypothetical protein
MLNKKSMLITCLSLIIALVGYTGLCFSLGLACGATPVKTEAHGCIAGGSACNAYLMVAVAVDLLNPGDFLTMVVENLDTHEVVADGEMTFVETSGDCDLYDLSLRVPCNAPYTYSVLLNGQGEYLETTTVVICPK